MAATLSTQNQALAVLLPYQKVLQVELPWLDGVVRAKQSHRLPVVLTPGEVKDVQFGYRQVIVRRSCSGTWVSGPRRSIPTSCARARTPCGARWIDESAPL